MKIELKHLAPYLPYKLTGVSKEGSAFYLATGNNMLGRGVEDRDIGTWLSTGIKPILRPLSDLTKEEYKNEILIRWGGGLYDYAKTRWLVDIINDMQYTAHNSLRYDFIEFLSEYHFDVFGLIPEGLAIDINTIK